MDNVAQRARERKTAELADSKARNTARIYACPYRPALFRPSQLTSILQTNFSRWEEKNPTSKFISPLALEGRCIV